MIDIKFLKENPELVKENIRKKFQDRKLPLVDEVIALDAEKREAETKGNTLRAEKNRASKEIGMYMAKGMKEEAEKAKAAVQEATKGLTELEARTAELEEKIKTIMMTIPNIIDDSVPVGKDDSENVEVERFG